MHIQQVQIKNFRCFDDLTVNLNPDVNIFVGNNGSGKSAVLDAIAEVWFKENYPNHSFVRISIHPNLYSTISTATGTTKALTLDKLNQLIADIKVLLTTLCESVLAPDELVLRCGQLLLNSTLKSQSIVDTYLVSFETEAF